MNAYRKNGKIVIEVDEDALVAGVEQMAPLVTVPQIKDREEFLNFCAEEICDFGDSGDFGGAPRFTFFLDDLVNHAIEMAAGIE